MTRSIRPFSAAHSHKGAYFDPRCIRCACSSIIPGIITRPLVSITVASGGIVASAARPTHLMVSPSISTAAWCSGGTSYPSSSIPPTSASCLGACAHSSADAPARTSVHATMIFARLFMSRPPSASDRHRRFGGILASAIPAVETAESRLRTRGSRSRAANGPWP